MSLTTELFYIFFYGFFIVKILISNDNHIQSIKQRFSQLQNHLKNEINYDIRKAIVKLEIDEIEKFISQSNKHLTLVIPISAVLIGILYYYFNGYAFFIMSLLTSLYTISENAVKQNFVKVKIRISQLI